MNSDVSLVDMAYFGAAWIGAELHGPNANFTLSNGYANPQVIRDIDGSFIAGIVEKYDNGGHLTDVILSFSGTQTPSMDDVTCAAILTGIGDPQTALAEQLLDQIMADPRYADANIHLTGHSMGGSLATWAFAHSLATNGAEETYDRVSVTSFAAPPWGSGMLAHFGLQATDFSGHVDNYAAENDPIHYLGLPIYLGTQHDLAAYLPWGDDLVGQTLAIARMVGHSQLVQMQGIGLPDWLTPQQKAALIDAQAGSGALSIYDADYGATGSVSQHIEGTAGSEPIVGGASADVIIGHGGADILTGGAGADTFTYNVGDSSISQLDIITDFFHAQGDRIDLHNIDAKPGNLLVNDDFQFVGTAQPINPGQVGYTWVQDYTLVVAHMGGGVPDLVLALQGHISLSASDFIL